MNLKSANSKPSRAQIPLLDLQNICVMRGNATNGAKTALDDLSLRINLSEHVAVLGPNGCGKSTLIKTITREFYPMVRNGSNMSILGKKNRNVLKVLTLWAIVSNNLMSLC